MVMCIKAMFGGRGGIMGRGDGVCMERDGVCRGRERIQGMSEFLLSG